MNAADLNDQKQEDGHVDEKCDVIDEDDEDDRDSHLEIKSSTFRRPICRNGPTEAFSLAGIFGIM
jgi:hypothetical protein